MYRSIRVIDTFNEFSFAISTFCMCNFTDLSSTIEDKIKSGWVMFWVIMLVLSFNILIYFKFVTKWFYLLIIKNYNLYKAGYCTFKIS